MNGFYSFTANLFPFVKTKQKLRLLLSPLYYDYYLVATIMRNGLSDCYFTKDYLRVTLTAVAQS